MLELATLRQRHPKHLMARCARWHWRQALRNGRCPARPNVHAPPDRLPTSARCDRIQRRRKANSHPQKLSTLAWEQHLRDLIQPQRRSPESCEGLLLRSKRQLRKPQAIAANRPCRALLALLSVSCTAGGCKLNFRPQPLERTRRDTRCGGVVGKSSLPVRICKIPEQHLCRFLEKASQVPIYSAVCCRRLWSHQGPGAPRPASDTQGFCFSPSESAEAVSFELAWQVPTQNEFDNAAEALLCAQTGGQETGFHAASQRRKPHCPGTGMQPRCFQTLCGGLQQTCPLELIQARTPSLMQQKLVREDGARGAADFPASSRHQGVAVDV